MLALLSHPDVPNLVPSIAKTLKLHDYPVSFGQQSIHQKLSVAQLDELIALHPAVLDSSTFVEAYINKLLPGADVDTDLDASEKLAYLRRLEVFFSKLSPAYNGHRVCLMYNQLLHGWRSNVFDEDLFFEYLKVPKRSSSVNGDYLDGLKSDVVPNFYGLPSIPRLETPYEHAEAELVTNLLYHFFSAEKPLKLPFLTRYLRESLLTEVHAKSQLLYSDKDLDKYTAILGSSAAQQLRESIEITLLPYNKKRFLPADVVQIDVELKNVPSVIVKVFELNTERYYKDNLQVIPDDVQLDGLIANEEKIFKYSQPPFRRHRERFDFPALSKRRGVFVIEFIGNGKSSRCVIRKGALGFTASFGANGHLLTVFDEERQHLKSASIWLNGHLLAPNDDGHISVPFTRSPGSANFVICNSADGFCDIGSFYHQSESYHLSANFYCDREQLLAGKKATVLVQARLAAASPVSLSLLKDVVFTVNTSDIDGVAASKEFKNVQLSDEQEATFEFQVPEKAQHITFSLKGTVKNLSSSNNDPISASSSVSLNHIDTGSEFRSSFLRTKRNGYEIVVLGKTGEAVVDRAYTVALKHRYLSSERTFTCQTNENGIIRLPALRNFEYVSLREDSQRVTWQLARDTASVPDAFHAVEGEVIQIPYSTNIAAPGDKPDALQTRALEPGEVALFTRSCSEELTGKVSFADGLLHVSGLTRGDYTLVLREFQQQVTLRVTKGVRHDNALVGAHRQLQLSDATPLQISHVELPTEKTPLKIHLKNFTPSTRVHIIATEFWPEYELRNLFGAASLSATEISSRASSFLDGRTLGDEYRYILERRYAKIFPGNTLTRPSLLLQPRVVQATSTSKESLLPDAKLRAHGMPMASPACSRAFRDDASRRESIAASPNLDFLSVQSALLVNLRPNKAGEISIPASDIHGGLVRVLAVDDESQAQRIVALDAAPATYKDLRLKKTRALAPDRHFTEQIAITELQPGETFVCEDITTSKIEVFDSLPKVFNLLSSLSNAPSLAEFGFVLSWNTLTEAEKQDKYSKFACHELNTFIKMKDAAFFDRVVRPYVVNKKEPTFIDLWLLGSDLSTFLTPSEFEKLNGFEKAALAFAVGGPSGAAIKQFLVDVADAAHFNAAQFNVLFNAALKGSSLDTDSNLEMASQVEEQFNKMDELDGLMDALSSADSYGGLREMKDEDAPMEKEESEKKREEMEEVADERRVSTLKKRKMGRAAPRDEAHEFYREIDQTKEFAETHYWNMGRTQSTASLVPVHQFWADYAKRDAKRPFLSKNFIWATASFPEVIFAIAVLDLPLQPPAPLKPEFIESQMSFTSATGSIVFHKDIKEAAVELKQMLATQTFFDPQDRYSYVRGEQAEKFVSEEFLRNKVYGCNVILTNIGSSRQRASVLLQIPVGAIPVSRGTVTKSQFVDIPPYQSTQIEYYFYWPSAGLHPHFPVHVARDERVIAFAQPEPLNVVESLSKIDKTNWDWTSQMGTNEEVLAYIKNENIHAINIDKIAWRMREKPFFEQAMPTLAARHRVTQSILGYSLLHYDVERTQQFIRWHSLNLANQVGYNLHRSIFDTDAVRLHHIEHLEYSPVVNARAHQVGAKRTILNDKLKAQYDKFVESLTLKPAPLGYEDLAALCYYMLLQDRIEEAQALFARIPADAFSGSAPGHLKLQYDYLSAYLDFFNEAPTRARDIATSYTSYPVPRWRKLFADIRQQLAEIDGVVSVAEAPTETDTRDQRNLKLAAKSVSLDFSISGHTVTLNYQATNKVTVKIFKMDIELLFSNSPFVQQDLGNFAYVMPNAQFEVKLPEDATTHSFELPQEFANANIMCVISSGPATAVKPHYSHSLHVNVMENFGQLKVASTKSLKPLARVYIKVYARHRDGRVAFFKDGYTDLRGGFDYISLNTADADTTEKLSILVMSENSGTRIVEARPPQK